MDEELVQPRGLPEGEHLEVWVVGQPNPAQLGPELIEFPPYRFQWTDELAQEHYDVPTAIEAARKFVENRLLDSTGSWTEGPRIVTRTVTCGPWSVVEW